MCLINVLDRKIVVFNKFVMLQLIIIGVTVERLHTQKSVTIMHNFKTRLDYKYSICL